MQIFGKSTAKGSPKRSQSTTSANWKKLMDIRIPGHRAGTLAAVYALLASGCLTRQQILAEAWLHDKLPAEVCLQFPELRQVGVYRKLNDDECQKKNLPVGCEEFISYCQNEIELYISFQKDKLNQLLDEAFGKDKDAIK